MNHRIQPIRFTPRSIFQLTQGIFIFWTKVSLKGYFQSKTEKYEHYH